MIDPLALALALGVVLLGAYDRHGDDASTHAAVARQHPSGIVLESDPAAARARAQPPRPGDAWIGEDKIQHFVMSYAVAVFIDAGARTAGVDERTARVGAVSGALLAGVLKEWYDRARGGIFSYRDLVWDAAGVATGMLVIRASRR
jgi:uncharacterized protein YfiM (DUF2279 family)